MSGERTSKSVASRIDTNYYRAEHPDRVRQRYWSRGSLVVATVIVLAIAMLGQRQSFQGGPLSRSHTLFAQDCRLCHTETWQTARRLATLSEGPRSVSDHACLACHPVADHQANVPKEKEVACSVCHREHQGGEHTPTVADARCVHCHGDLRTSEGPSTRFAASVSSWAEHPEFAALRHGSRDPGTLRFNHAVHMVEGGVLAPGRTREELQCSSCHVPDADRSLFRPVNFDLHCRRCHENALAFDPAILSGQRVPHKSVEIVRDALWGSYSRKARSLSWPELLNKGTTPRLNPARPRPDVHELFTEKEQAAIDLHRSRHPDRDADVPFGHQQAWIDDRLKTAERVLFEGGGGCRYCHQVNRDKESWRIAPVSVPDSWLPNGRFPHVDHQMLACLDCHSASGSRVSSDVLIPSIKTCASCHQGGGSSGHVRADCATCHWYHDRSKTPHWNGPFPIDPERWASTRSSRK